MAVPVKRTREKGQNPLKGPPVQFSQPPFAMVVQRVVGGWLRAGLGSGILG